MTRSAVAALALLLCSAAPVFAQTPNPKVQVFGGYSLLHADSGGLTPAALNSALHQPAGTFGVTANFSGWNAQIQYNLNRWVGVAADFAGHYGLPFPSSNTLLQELPNSNEYSLLFGPVLTYKNKTKFTPFVHAFGGFDRSHLDAGSIPGLFGSSSYVTDWAPAVAVGGGVDYKAFSHASIRLGQFDYFYTGHNLNSYYGDAFGPNVLPALADHENNLRFSTGLVLRF